ncbi:MAG: DUF4160 domain-containing protein [Kiritimatiellae bacterium]|nr:DUF4160 domain-containing protein [Kiritimatiellia bacterium]
MPHVSDFYGVIIWMYWDEKTSKHHLPHIHAEYFGHEAVVSIPEGEVLDADPAFPQKKIRMVQTWIDIHAEELMADWSLAERHGEIFKIRGLDK